MAIYHLEAKVVSRGAGRSVCAAAAYMSCSAIYNDYDGIQHDYTRKQGLVWQEVFLPEYAPAEWQDRAVLWNAVEEEEKTKDSRLAREFVVALPIEFGKDQWQSLVSDFIREQFVSDGMCADCAIHDTDGHNPHAHILLTVRPLDEHGKWQYKTEKEYLCVRDGEERGFTASEFKAAQADGWEKQYPYYVDKKKKEYLPPSEAEARGLERADKHPKSTKFGRQNPITERWNSDEQLVEWRKAWADTVNRALERSGLEERIDHRSHAERGIDEQPTVHEGVEARAMERKGFVSDRCELNRQIKADNALLRELKAAVRKLMQAVQNTIPSIAAALENLRKNMILLRYMLTHKGRRKQKITEYLSAFKPEYERFCTLTAQIRDKSQERKTATGEKESLSPLALLHHRQLAQRITTLTEELEELHSERAALLNTLRYPENTKPAAMQKDIADFETELRRIAEQERKYRAELTKALADYAEIKQRSEPLDRTELYRTRLALRPGYENAAIDGLRKMLGGDFSAWDFRDAVAAADNTLGERTEENSVRELLRTQKRQTQEKPSRCDMSR